MNADVGRTRPPEPPAFLCDEMLGRLARTLRLLGFDTLYLKDVTDDEVLARLAAAPERTLLTRDVELAGRAERRGLRAVLVREIEAVEQAREVLEDRGLQVNLAKVLTRCAVCNTVLRPAREEEIQGRLHGAREPFRWCEACAKLYWEGSHGPRIRALAERLAPRDG